MRVLLDAQVSSRRIGRRLVAAGHDVVALDQDPALGKLADEDVLAVAAEQERIVLTHNVRHLAAIARQWAEAQRHSSGLVLITLPHTAYGAILRGLERAFEARPVQRQWIDRTEFLGRE